MNEILIQQEPVKMYFGKAVEEAIDSYNKAPTKRLKNQIFNSVIYPALNKLVENVIHDRKFYKYGDDEYVNIKHDCVVWLSDRLHKFNPERGHKAFSYFNQIAVNWVRAEMKRVNLDQYKGSLEEIDLRRDVINEVALLDYQEELKDFCYKWSVWGNSNLDHFYFIRDGREVPFNQKDKQIANAIFDLFANCEHIDIYNKKALYILIRERIEVKTQNITDTVNLLKPFQRQMYKEYLVTGTDTWNQYPPKRRIENEQGSDPIQDE